MAWLIVLCVSFLLLTTLGFGKGEQRGGEHEAKAARGEEADD